jgi:[amino group carrier protein]-lysine/ornithine hydrolase
MTLVERLVRCSSPSGDEGEVASVVIAEMKSRGFVAREDGIGNALGTVGHGTKSIYLIGHLDTVPGDLTVRVDDGKLYGRGSVDAKGPLATCIEAATRCAESDAATVTVIGCVGEEADSRGARHILETMPSPDYVVIAEPSGWAAITLGYKGSLPVRYTVTKPQTHRGAPTSTVAEDAVTFYERICSAYPERGTGFEDLTIRLTSLNTSQDVGQENAKLSLDVRTPPGFDSNAFCGLVQDAVHGATVSFGDAMPAVLRDKRNPLVRAMLAAIRSEDGQPVFKRKTGTSDMNLFQQWNVPMIAYGPGDSSLDHTPDEHLNLAEYERGIAVLKRALMNLVQG